MLNESFALNAVPLSPGRRVYAIGDVHGRRDLLAKCLDEIRRDLAGHPCQTPHRVFLGDYIDRGPDSAGVLQTLIDLDDGIPTTFLAGNHEVYLTQFLQDASALKMWSRVGGATALASYGVDFPFRLGPAEMAEVLRLFTERLPGSHRLFLERLDLKLEIEGFTFVHAGIRPNVPMHRQTAEDILTIREPFLTELNSFGTFVVHGHTPVEKPEIWPNRMNIDTRAVESGLLTCAVIEGSEVRFLWGLAS
ncbi:metallophosphoesterase [Agaricicola taiwanensis]|uniref:Metallophosphoesterase n=1 Tax=Agaricicola taiwanensis TaxID=591372 RepID=A0A8J2YKI3_9RHOB|nr:metallophosphoesterase [Agaricicola taiwanensis]GGE48720.1 metallophosphoesterase [Agaricicola taiwanensis]